MRKPSSSNPSEDPSDPLDPDWAPQIPSIWDDEDEDPEPFAFDPPWSVATPAAEWLDPAAWMAAERGAATALAAAVAAVVRLDERLLGMDPATRAGAHTRLALETVPDLLWFEGVRVRPEHLALAGADRMGGGEDAPIIARALWAVRRMTAGPRLTQVPSAEEVRAFLGLAAPADMQAWEAPGMPEPIGVDAMALADWSAALAKLGDAHPLTRAAMAGALWQGLGVTGGDRLLEPALVLARLAAAAGQGGLIALPLGPARPTGDAGAETRLHAGLARMAEGAQAGLRLLDRTRAWHARAEAATTGLKGHGVPQLVDLLATRPIVSGPLVAESLDLTDRHARRLLKAFEERQLIREMTGHARFRFWATRL